VTRQFPHPHTTLPGHDKSRVRTAADFLALPDDPDDHPDIRATRMAEHLAGMLATGELDTLPPDTRAALALMPMALLDMAGDVRVMRLNTTEERL
jgi:hypothetical protein